MQIYIHTPPWGIKPRALCTLANAPSLSYTSVPKLYFTEKNPYMESSQILAGPSLCPLALFYNPQIFHNEPRTALKTKACKYV
jgi:hypothetical protein